ncbi:MAG: hypothetical protein ASARMPREDX12_006631 [Alectoria sarmentosa]|nr:MAG: hypothetical protein ASARMPRED_006109 [Alectoria sarmentosa]CAD6592979.1 MAG: hypothetical protein ASARMPREDX12_006631 [Alectoria sarmentosa]
MPTSDEISASEITLTPATDGVSEYQQYLEKTSRRDSRGDASLSSRTVNGEIRRHNSLENAPAHTVDKEIQLGVPAVPMLEAIRPAHERKKPPHRVEAAEDPYEYPGPLALSLLTVGICLSVFLVSLDRTIVATAIPRITDDFHSSDDVGWYGSAYLVTAGALQPIYGRIFIMFNIKWSFLCALGIFELGSLICGVSPNSLALIVGRALAGWGSAGILTGSFVVVAHAVPLQRRPVFSAAVGVMFGLGAIVGPLLGGAFTDRVTWRWCFYFNLPVCGATVVSMILFFRPHKDAQESDKPLRAKLLALDLFGNFLLIVAAVMLFLALQFNEQNWAWGSVRIVGLLVGSGITAILFVLWQWRQGDKALLPPRIILQRSVAASCLGAFLIYGTFLIHAYYLPIWFQAIKNDSAIMSGVSLIAYVIGNALFSVIAGILVSKVGYFAPPAIIGAAIGTVGCGLLSTLQVDSGPGRWVGYQVVSSAGLGMAVQQGVIAVQTVLTLEQIPIGIAAIISMQSLGGAVFVSVGNNILQNILDQASAAKNLPGIDVKAVITAGATQFRSIVPAESLPALLVAYNYALQRVFIAAIPLSGLAFIFALGLEWKSVRDKKPTLEAALGPATEYSVDGEGLEASQSRRRSVESIRTTESREKTSFETARTSLQYEMMDLPEAAHPRQSQLSVPGSWCD